MAQENAHNVIQKVKALLADAEPETLLEIRAYIDSLTAAKSTEATNTSGEDLENGSAVDPDDEASEDSTAATPPSDTAANGPVTPKQDQSASTPEEPNADTENAK